MILQRVFHGRLAFIVVQSITFVAGRYLKVMCLFFFFVLRNCELKLLY